jgi:hypothetical protein
LLNPIGIKINTGTRLNVGAAVLDLVANFELISRLLLLEFHPALNAARKRRAYDVD